MAVRWTLDELVRRAGVALAADGVQAPNGRVTSTPDRRVVRWYATIGLIDRPLAYQGRVALYGPRHLWQVVAVKRRQAQGRTIAEIQAELAGITDAALVEIAAVPSGLDGAHEVADGPSGVDRDHEIAGGAGAGAAGGGAVRDPGPVDGAGAGPSQVARRSRFWATPPARKPEALVPRAAGEPTAPTAGDLVAGIAFAGDPGVAGDRDEPPAAEGADEPPAAEGADEPPAAEGADEPPAAEGADEPPAAAPAEAPAAPPVARRLCAVALHPAATLLLYGQPTAEDLAAIGDLARPLIDLLNQRGLLGPEGARSE